MQTAPVFKQASIRPGNKAMPAHLVFCSADGLRIAISPQIAVNIGGGNERTRGKQPPPLLFASPNKLPTLVLHQGSGGVKFVREGCEENPTGVTAASRLGEGGRQRTVLQETVKRKLEGARSPLNGEQQNGACDGSFSPTSKRIRKDLPTGMEAINNLPNNMPLPSASPCHQLDLKPSLPLQNSAAHTPGLLEDLGKNGRLPEIKLPVNGCGDLEDSFAILQSKDLKQEPLDDPACIDTSETSLSNQNKLFSDINLNDQEWQELIDELANTVPEDDIQDLFNEDFEEKKDPEFSQTTMETPLSHESASVKSDASHSPFAHVSMGSPQARPSSSGPPFATVSTATSLPSVANTPVAPNPASSPANCAVQSPQTPTQAHTPGQAPARPGNGYLLNPISVTEHSTVLEFTCPGITGLEPSLFPGSVSIGDFPLKRTDEIPKLIAGPRNRA
ncbi:hypothetical protein NN561_008418 [Cricetulus griseus]